MYLPVRSVGNIHGKSEVTFRQCWAKAPAYTTLF